MLFMHHEFLRAFAFLDRIILRLHKWYHKVYVQILRLFCWIIKTKETNDCRPSKSTTGERFELGHQAFEINEMC